MTAIPHHQVLLSGLNFPEGPVLDSMGAIWSVELPGGILVKNSEGDAVRFQNIGKNAYRLKIFKRK